MPGFHDDCVMSYLIGMYVYYHGNNLSMFGFVKGSQEIKDQNKGMKGYEDIQYSNLIPERDIQIMKEQEEVRKENNYEEMMRRAIIESQRNSMILQQRGLTRNEILESTPDGLMDDLYYSDGEMDMGFFDELNGM